MEWILGLTDLYQFSVSAILSDSSGPVPGVTKVNYKWRNDESTEGRNCWWWFSYHLDEIFRIASDKFCLIKSGDDNILAGGDEVLIIDYLKYFSQQNLALGTIVDLEDKYAVMKSEMWEKERELSVQVGPGQPLWLMINTANIYKISPLNKKLILSVRTRNWHSEQLQTFPRKASSGLS